MAPGVVQALHKVLSEIANAPAIRTRMEAQSMVVPKLQGWGCTAVRGYGKTSVLGSLRRGSSHRAICIRADGLFGSLEKPNGIASRFLCVVHRHVGVH